MEEKIVYVASMKDDDSLIYGYGNGITTEVFKSENSAKEWLLEWLMDWLNRENDTEYESVGEMLDEEEDNIYWDDEKLIHLGENGFEDEFRGSYKQQTMN